jgi:progressive ankylosis protein
MQWRFTRFLFPLVITIIVQEFGVQYVNAGMARMPQATETLAAFALAWGLILFLAGPLAQAKQLSLVLVDSQANYRKSGLFVLAVSLFFMAVQISLVTTPLGDWVIDDLHRIDGTLSEWVRVVLVWMAPIPLLRNASLFYTGLLIRTRRTDVISYATAVGIACGIAAVSLLLTVDAVRARPIWLPILATYAMTVAEFAVLYSGYRRYVRLPLVRTNEETGSPLTFSYTYILQFFWPLALIMFVQELSRPLINLFIARGPDGTVALAVLSISYALGQWPYRWLNEIRNLPPTFHAEDQGLRAVRRFALACGVVSFALSATLFWTPVRDFILGTLMGVEADLAQASHWPLALYTFFSFVVVIRAYLHGICLLEHRTRALAPSAPVRVSTILLLLVTLPAVGVSGATLGVAALLGGFVGETIAVWWGVRGHALFASRFKRETLPAVTHSD